MPNIVDILRGSYSINAALLVALAVFGIISICVRDKGSYWEIDRN